MSPAVRIGTRSSPLALAQAGLVLGALRREAPRRRFELVGILTAGDRGGAATDFTGALAEALRSGRIDLAVHSAKDLPARDPPDLVVAAYPRRADFRDCVVRAPGRRGPLLPDGARVGSSSRRRRAQLLRARPDLTVVPIRGNVDSRLRRLDRGDLDAVVLAAAGLLRLGRADAIGGYLDPARFLPCPGQGALAVAVRRADRPLRALARRLDHPATRSAVAAERAVAAGLGTDCDAPFGALGRVRGGALRLRAELLEPEGRSTVAASGGGPAGAPLGLARAVARRLRAGGADALLGTAR